MIYTGVKEKVYLFFMLYLTFQVMYSLTVIDLNPISRLNIIYYYPIIEQIFPEIVIFTFIGFYVFFIIILFETYRNPLLKKVATSLAWLCFAYALFNIIYLGFFAGIEGKQINYQISRMTIMPINFILIIWIIIRVKYALTRT